MKIAFFDRDGTIAQDYADKDWANVKTPVFMPYAIQVLSYLNRIGYQIIIVTNQYLIGEEFITQKQYEAYNDLMLKELKKAGVCILDVFYCPHARTDNCSCIKPKTGLILQALSKYPEIELPNSFIVGDSLCDIQLAENMNIPAYGINVEYNYKKFTKIGSLEELLSLSK